MEKHKIDFWKLGTNEYVCQKKMTFDEANEFAEKNNYDFFLSITEIDISSIGEQGK